MKILAKTKENDIATVFIAEHNGNKLEFVESVQPPRSIYEKWVLVISTLYGCPVKCSFCDSGGFYNGKIKKAELLEQIMTAVKYRFPDNYIDTDIFKIQFARMGEPAMNNDVTKLLDELPVLLNVRGKFIPSLSTIAPAGTDKFFRDLLEIKNRHYANGFQLQFSLHSTSQKQRDILMPFKKWNFSEIADYGNKFFNEGNRKITLNFALAETNEFDTKIIRNYFNPDIFLIKITPVNPTINALNNSIADSDAGRITEICDKLKLLGYESIHSIGELEENQIGSNCGQFLTNYLNQEKRIFAYTYALENEIQNAVQKIKRGC